MATHQNLPPKWTWRQAPARSLKSLPSAAQRVPPMPDFLTFALAAPLAAMGEIAVGERRGSWDRPARSAILGLIAACLGLAREDEAAHAALETGYGLTLRRQRLGPLLADYHTAQVPPKQ